jgi:hypothetical protein
MFYIVPNVNGIIRIYLYNVSIQHYVVKFVSELRQVCGILRVLGFPPPRKLTATI